MKKLILAFTVFVISFICMCGSSYAAENSGGASVIEFVYDGGTVTINGDTAALRDVLSAAGINDPVTGVVSGNITGSLFTVDSSSLSLRISSTAANGFAYSTSADAWVRISTASTEYVFYLNYYNSVSVPITDPDVRITVNGNYTYTGAEIIPEVTVAYGNETLYPDSDYVLSCRNNINAGQAVAVINGIGKYSGSVSVPFVISKADFVPAAVVGLTYNGNAQTLVTAEGIGSGVIEYSFDGRSFAAGNDKAVDAGEYKVYYRLTGSENYNDTDGSGFVTAVIGKQNVTVTIKGSTATRVYDGTIQRVSGYSIVSGNSLYQINSGNLSFIGTDIVTASEAGTYELILKDKFVNKNDNFNVSFDITNGWLKIVRKSLAGVTMQNRTFDYTGDYNPSYRPMMPDGTNLPADTTVMYGVSPDNINSLSSRMFKTVGAYKIYYKITGSDYEDKTGSATITIVPIAAELEWPSEFVSEAACKPVVKNLISGDTCNATVAFSRNGNTVTARVTALSNNNYKLVTNITKAYTVASTAQTTVSAGSGRTSSGTAATGNAVTQSRSSGTGTAAKSTGSSTLSLTSVDEPSRSKSSDDAADYYFDDDDDIIVIEDDDETALAEDVNDNEKSALSLGLDELLSDDKYDDKAFLENDGILTEDDMITESVSVGDDVYDSEGNMTYGRMAHLASPEGYPVIFAILLVMIVMCLTAGIVFAVVGLRRNSKSR